MNSITLEEILKQPYKKPTIVARTAPTANKPCNPIKNWLYMLDNFSANGEMSTTEPFYSIKVDTSQLKSILEKA